MSGYYSTWIPAPKNDRRRSWRRELIGHNREEIGEYADEIREMLCSGGAYFGKFFPERVTAHNGRRHPSKPPTPPDDE